MLETPLHEDLLPNALAWAALAAICYNNEFPITGFNPSQPILGDKPLRNSTFSGHQTFQALLLFVFHTLVSDGNRVDVLILPLLSYATFILPQIYVNQDCEFSRRSSAWSSQKPGSEKPRELKSISWVLLNGLNFGYWYSSMGMKHAFADLLTIFTGLCLFVTLPKSFHRIEDAAAKQSYQQVLLPVLLQSMAFAILSWLFSGAQILDGTVLPVLTIMLFISMFQTNTKGITFPWLLLLLIYGSVVVQFIISLPQNIKKRRPLWVLFATPIVLTAILKASHTQPSPTAGISLAPHPIQALHQTNLADFERRRCNQSQTASQAAAEYQRRYKRQPPPSFDTWFKLAQTNDFLLVDEFDTIMASIIPFWQLPSHLLRQRLVSLNGTSDFLHFQVRNNNATYTPEVHYHGFIMTDLINKYASYGLLPDFDFVVNVLDEPRTSVPFEASQAVLEGIDTSEWTQNDSFNVSWTDLGWKNLKSELTSSCPSGSFQHKESQSAGPASSLRFVSDVKAEKDFCQTPTLFDQHGFFHSPETVKMTRSFLPILSQCKPMNFHDILYPSPYYVTLGGSDDEFVKGDDMDWKRKHNSLYWSGTSTGGRSNFENWSKLHRQRLALLTSPDSNHSTHLLRKDKTIGWCQYYNPWSRVSSLFNVKINHLAQCHEGACEAMMDLFPVGHKDPARASISSKYALDVDGNAFSGRFYRLLRSKACVLKMTAFQEWHDDFLWPWVHYIPVSVSYDELGEIVRYLHEEPEGQLMGKKVADLGRNWSRKILRDVDLEIVTMRVLMELARILNGED